MFQNRRNPQNLKSQENLILDRFEFGAKEEKLIDNLL